MSEKRILQQGTRGEYLLSLPAQVVRILGWQKGDIIQIRLKNQTLNLRKKKCKS
ncbi:MAG: hypothetical protein ACE5R6_20145 [Candidatus Heimdallarchaeota archaeon]